MGVTKSKHLKCRPSSPPWYEQNEEGKKHKGDSKFCWFCPRHSAWLPVLVIDSIVCRIVGFNREPLEGLDCSAFKSGNEWQWMTFKRLQFSLWTSTFCNFRVLAFELLPIELPPTRRWTSTRYSKLSIQRPANSLQQNVQKPCNICG